MTTQSSVLVTKGDNGYYHATIKVESDNDKDCRRLLDILTKSIMDGRASWVRRKCQIDKHNDFSSGLTSWRGFSRFSFKDEPGESLDSRKIYEDDPNFMNFGFGIV